MEMDPEPDKYEENRHYWKIQRVIPKSGVYGPGFSFKIYNGEWFCRTSYDDEGRLRSLISIFRMPKVPLLNMRSGICEKTQKIIAVSEKHAPENRTTLEPIPIHRSELESAMQTNKDLYFFIEVIKNDDGKIQDAKTRKRKIEKDFEELLFSGKNSDLILEVDCQKFKCHRSILSARSPVFSAMMEHNMKEKNSGTVTIKDAEPIAFQEFLLYLYTGNEDCLNRKNVIELYTLGDKYVVEDLKNLCIQHMKQSISTENFLEVFLLSQQRNEPELGKVTIEFFVKNSKEIIETEKWIEFLRSNPNESNILIKVAIRNK